jgi:hypothetical protein
MKNKSLVLQLGMLAAPVLLFFILQDYAYTPLQKQQAAFQEDIIVQRKLLAKYLGIIEQKPKYEEAYRGFERLKQTVETQILNSKTESLAKAELQKTVKDIVTGKGGVIVSERAEKTEDKDGFKLLNVRIDADLATPAMVDEILYEIASSAPVMIVDLLEIRVNNIRQPGPVKLTLSVSALARIP